MKPTTEHIITALRDGIALRTDLCERLGCQNAALTKVIRNMLDRKLITRDLQDGALAYYLTSKGRAWRPGMQSASVRAKAREAKVMIGDATALPIHQGFRCVQPIVDECRKTLSERPAAIDNETGDSYVWVSTPEPAKDGEVSSANEAKADIHAPQYDPRSVSFNPMEREEAALEQAERLSAELTNARALADKLQSLLTSKEHECEALRVQLGEPRRAPALALHDHIYAVAAALYDGQNITIGKETLVVQSQCRNFRCKPQDVKSVLDASDMLARLEAA